MHEPRNAQFTPVQSCRNRRSLSSKHRMDLPSVLTGGCLYEDGQGIGALEDAPVIVDVGFVFALDVRAR